MMLSALAILAVFTLLVFAGSVIASLRSLRLRERLCPQCQGRTTLTRMPRRPMDRAISVMVDCRRYRCQACFWSGLIRSGVIRTDNEAVERSDFELPRLRQYPDAPTAEG